MPKYPVIQENEETGWSDWLQPMMKSYKMACCDCGLVHELEFKVIKQRKVLKRFKDGTTLSSFEEIEDKKYQISMRARRHTRATAQHRRHKKTNQSLNTNN